MQTVRKQSLATETVCTRDSEVCQGNKRSLPLPRSPHMALEVCGHTVFWGKRKAERSVQERYILGVAPRRGQDHGVSTGGGTVQL